jgi:anti-anti-sigma factor
VPEGGPFDLTTEDVGDAIRVVVVSGDADRFRADAVARAIQQARDDGRDVVVDLSQASYMDSTMVATLVAASERGRRRSARLVIVVKAARLRRSLEVKGLEPILTVSESREDALELLGETA